jgi:hypothetical protein
VPKQLCSLFAVDWEDGGADRHDSGVEQVGDGKMKEGKFEYELKRCYFDAAIEDVAIPQTKAMVLIDEAKKEFPWRNILTEIINGKQYWSEADIKETCKWFLKWFGDEK